MVVETGEDNGTETGEVNFNHRDNPKDREFDVFLLASTSKLPVSKSADNVPVASAWVYHGRGNGTSHHFRDKTVAVHTIKIRFEKIIEKGIKDINVPKVFEHTAHSFFLADPELARMPIDPSGEEQRIIKKTVNIPPSKGNLQGHLKYHRSFWKIEGIFRMQTCMTIQELKTNRDIYQFTLKDNKIFCKQTEV